jgi:hypothetical protein
MVEIDYGCDIDSNLELDPETGDFKIVEGVDNAIQAVKNRLETRLDELISLGYVNYGNQAYEELGITDTFIAIGHTEIYTKNCLLEEPVVEDLLSMDIYFKDNTLYGELVIKLVNSEEVPVSFEINDDLEDE